MPTGSAVCAVAGKLQGYVRGGSASPENYVRNLICTKSQYLDAFVEGRPFPPFEVEIQMSSHCNLQCRWCIGAAVQQRRSVQRLSDNLDDHNIHRIVDDIIGYEEGGLRIELVKFSGFIGEPLLTKRATLNAIQRLSGAGFKVGLFTNGILMTKDTWKTLANMHYVNVSLDAGPRSYFWLKEPAAHSFTYEGFRRIISQIRGLREERDRVGGTANITVSYVVVPGNHDEIFETAQAVKRAGADRIRFKCDISGVFELKGECKAIAFEQLKRAGGELEDERFAVTIIHSEDDVEGQTYLDWQCSEGCHYQQFATTIGSDGNVYLCDHNTMPGAIPLGNAVDTSFVEVWRGERRRFLVTGIPYICQCQLDPKERNPCPPFGNAVNPFLRDLLELAKEHGAATVKEALAKLRVELGCEG